MKSLIPYIKGHVRLRFWCEKPERFLNLCAYHQIVLTNLNRNGEIFECLLSLKDVRRLQDICRKTQTRIKIMEKHGLPFFFYRQKKRKAFFIGIFLGLVLLYLCSTRVWNIHIEGNYSNSTQMILRFLETQDICHGIAKKEINCAQTAAQIRRAFPDITWVSAKLVGTELVITVQENENPQAQEKASEENLPADLVADKSGVIVKMITRQGVPMMTVGQKCKKGDLLVQGRIDLQNDAGEIVRYAYVQADADVYVSHVYTYKDSFPLIHEQRQYTGKKKSRYFLQILKKRLEIGAPFGRPFTDYDQLCRESNVYLTENFLLPVSYGMVTEMEYQKNRIRYSKEEANERANEKLILFLEKLLEKGVQICENNVKIECTDTMCISQGTLVVIEKIGVANPIPEISRSPERNESDDEQQYPGTTDRSSGRT